MSDDTEMTAAKTMWSESLFETLHVALEKNKDDGTIKEILIDLKNKGYDKEYLLNKVKKRNGPNAYNRVYSIYGGKKSATGKNPKAQQAKAARKGAEQEDGVVGKLKGVYRYFKGD